MLSRGKRIWRKIYSGFKSGWDVTPSVPFENNYRNNRDYIIDFGKYDIVKLGNVSPERLCPVEIKKPLYVTEDYDDLHTYEILKTDEEIQSMKRSCRLAKYVLDSVGQKVKVGVTTDELDEFCHNLIIKNGAYPSPLLFKNFPKSICTSVNNVVCHGIPDDRRLVDGDIITVDVTVYLNGYHGDCAATFFVGNVDEKGVDLVKSTKEILEDAIRVCKPGISVLCIGECIENRANMLNLTVIPSITGHGIGREFHSAPVVWHTNAEEYTSEVDIMTQGMVFTIEPAIGQGDEEVELYEDGWTVMTADNSRTAQFEHTVLITENGVEILTD